MKWWPRLKQHTPKPQAVVLVYHRVAEPAFDPWQLCVPPALFAEQLAVLTTHFQPVSLTQLLEGVHQRRHAPRSVCVTFDDGYLDNYEAAKPLLEAAGCPAAFFIASSCLQRQKMFWWDELEAVALHNAVLPEAMELPLPGREAFRFVFERDRVLTDDHRAVHRRWVWTDPPPTERCAFYLALWAALKPLPDAAIRAAMSEVRTWASASEQRLGDDRPMSVAQLTEMGHHPLFELGLHTATHPSLPAHPKSVQNEEVETCERFFLQNDIPFTKALAYPYGDHNEVTKEVVRERGLLGAFTTKASALTRNTEPAAINRCAVPPLEAGVFHRWLDQHFNAE